MRTVSAFIWHPFLYTRAWTAVSSFTMKKCSIGGIAAAAPASSLCNYFRSNCGREYAAKHCSGDGSRRFFIADHALALSRPLVSAKELADALKTFPHSIRCVDASWHLQGDRNSREEFQQGHLPGAVFFDIDEVADQSSSLPHMIPSEEVFSAKVSDMGISSDHTVVVYNTAQAFSAPRCWWTFRVFGHKGVHVLDGGLPAWKEAGGALEQGVPTPKSTRPSKGLVQPSGNTWKLRDKGFRARLNAPMLRTWRQVLNQSEQERETAGQIVDARSLARFLGEAPEPRAGVAGGHVPRSMCVPFSSVLAEGDITRFRSPPEIRKAFEDAGVDVDSPLPITTTCGSGVTAAVLTFALELAGRKSEISPVYDGAWAEWGARDDLPKAKEKQLD